MREQLLALAGELEEYEGDTCEGCAAYEQPECRGYLPCTEIVARYCARKVREIAEKGAEDVTTVSAYDLLPDDDREALAWVREYGGLEQTSLDFAEGMAFGDIVDDIAARLGVSVAGLDSQDARYRIMPLLDRRLMPEGMEWLLEVWPKWSNGEYCKFGDWWIAAKYGEHEPKQLRRLVFYTPEQLKEWEQDEGDNYGYEWDFMRPSDTDYRPDKVETPAPKVLAADGKPLEVGQTVWDTTKGKERTVIGFDKGKGEFFVKLHGFDPGYDYMRPHDLTHQRPVLDADSVPIKEGDTVYVAPFDDPLTVRGFAADGRVLMDYHSDDSFGYRPERLTHARPEPPDSWERIEEDAKLWPCEYAQGHPGWVEYDGRLAEFMALDLVRRCKALAERGA